MKRIIAIGSGATNALESVIGQVNSADYFAIHYNTSKKLIDKESIKIIQPPLPYCYDGTFDNPQSWLVPELSKEVQELLYSPHDKYFIACLGSYTGTFLGEAIFRELLENEIPFKAVCTVPFRFEGKRRMEYAMKQKDLFKMNSNFVFIENENLRSKYGNMSLKEAFQKSDEEILNELIKLTH